VFWFLGSAVIGYLYDISTSAVVMLCVITRVAALPIFIWVGRHLWVR
jgi:hypothetical protein